MIEILGESCEVMQESIIRSLYTPWVRTMRSMILFHSMALSRLDWLVHWLFQFQVVTVTISGTGKDYIRSSAVFHVCFGFQTSQIRKTWKNDVLEMSNNLPARNIIWPLQSSHPSGNVRQGIQGEIIGKPRDYARSTHFFKLSEWKIHHFITLLFWI